jgi:hypothetical protein
MGEGSGYPDTINKWLFEIIGCLGKCFPREYTGFVFGKEPDMNLMWQFAQYVLMKLMKYAYDITAPRYPLRHFLNYSSDDNTERMEYSRILI